MNVFEEKLRDVKFLSRVLKKYDPYLLSKEIEDITEKIKISYVKNYWTMDKKQDLTAVGYIDLKVPHYFAINYSEGMDEEHYKKLVNLDAQNLYINATLDNRSECTCFSLFFCNLEKRPNKTEYVQKEVYSDDWQPSIFGQKLPAEVKCLYFCDSEEKVLENILKPED